MMIGINPQTDPVRTDIATKGRPGRSLGEGVSATRCKGIVTLRVVNND
jgi:hypothetical protein